MSELVLKGVENDEELRLASDLMAKAHCRDYFTGLHWLETIGAGYPGFCREHVRIGIWKGEIVGALRLNFETIRLGEARLRLAGFGWITTCARFRGKVVVRALMGHTMRYLVEQRCHLAMLFGIPHVYRRFGFATALEEHAVLINVSETVPPRCPAFKMRDGKPGDIRAIQRLHEASDAGVACSVVRSAGHISNQWDRWRGVKVLTDQSGRVFAYFVREAADGEMIVEEAAAESTSACDALLAACLRVAASESRTCIRFRVPPAHPLSEYLSPHALPQDTHAESGREGMMALVNVEETFESMIPEWENLIAAHEARDWRIEVTLVVDRVPYRVRTMRGAVDVARVSGQNKVSLYAQELVQMLTGTRRVEEILDAERRLLTTPARELIALLFPKRSPFVWPLDRF